MKWNNRLSLSRFDLSEPELVYFEMNFQIKIEAVNWMDVARALRRTYGGCFPDASGELLLPVASVSRICKNTFKRWRSKATSLNLIDVNTSRLMDKHKARTEVMGRTGGTGPPETDLERSLRYRFDCWNYGFDFRHCILQFFRTILAVDYSATIEHRRNYTTPNSRGLHNLYLWTSIICLISRKRKSKQT